MAQRLLLQAQTALNSYAEPDWAAGQGWPAFADRLLDLARGCRSRLGSPAGVRQRAVHSVLSGCCGQHLAVLADLLDNDPAEYGWPDWSSTPICGGAS